MLQFKIPVIYGDSLAFFVCRYIFLFVFGILNIGLFLFLRKNNIGSPNATRLIRIQTALDILYIFLMPTINFEETDLVAPLNIHFLRFYCYFWFPSTFLWFISYFNTGAIILLSFERLICIVYPFHYRKITKRRVYQAICVGFLIYFTIASVDIYNLTKDISTHVIVNNQTFFKCVYDISNFLNLYNKIYSIFSCIILYLLPFLCLLFINIISTLTLYKSIKTKATNQLSEISSRHRIFLRFSLANILSSLFYGVFLLFFVVYIICVQNVNQNFVKIFNYYIIYFNSLLSIFNPIVYMILFRKFRKFVFTFCNVCHS